MSTSELLTDAEIGEFLESLRSSAARHASALQAVEGRLGLEVGFVQRLMDEKDDWAFIIKIAVVVESALGQVISASLMNDALARHIRSIPMDGRAGKIQLAQDLDLIGPKSAARFRALFEVRNDFAHGLKIVELSIPEYFARMTEIEFESTIAKFFSRDGEVQVGSGKPKKRSSEESAAGSRDGRIGKYLVWTCACVALLELSVAQRKIDSEGNWRSALMTLGHAFLSRQQGDEESARRHMRAAIDTLESVVRSPILGTPKEDA